MLWAPSSVTWHNSQDIQSDLFVHDNICCLGCSPPNPNLLSAVFFVLPVQESTWVYSGWQWPPSCTSRSSLSCCSASPSSHQRGLSTLHLPQTPHWSQSCWLNGWRTCDRVVMSTRAGTRWSIIWIWSPRVFLLSSSSSFSWYWHWESIDQPIITWNLLSIENTGIIQLLFYWNSQKPQKKSAHQLLSVTKHVMRKTSVGFVVCLLYSH